MKRAAMTASLCLAAACSMVAGPGGSPGEPAGAGPPRGSDTRRPARVRRAVEALPAALSRFAEVRGVWVVRTSMTTEARVTSMVEAAHAAGFNTLILQVRGRGDAFYSSRWEPRSESVEGSSGFDPLALAVEAARARGMAVHAWVNTHLVWGVGAMPQSPDHMVNRHPDWLGVPRDLGRELYDVDPFDPRFVEALQGYAADNPGTVEGLYSSPSHPAVKERVYDVVVDLVERYELDGIHLDYVRFPNGAYDYSLGALERFRVWVRPRLSSARWRALDEAYARDPYAFVDALAEPWDEFRRAQITELVERAFHGIKSRRPAMALSAAVFADAQDAYESRFQDWRGWLEEGVLDVAVPMAYTPDNVRFHSQVLEASVSAGRRERVWAGIGAYLNTVEGTLDKIDIARQEGVGGVILFSYDWASEEDSGSMSYLERVGRTAFTRR